MFLFVALIGVEPFKKPLHSPIEIGDALFLTDRPDYIVSKITNEIKSAMGEIEYNFLLQQSLFAYSESSLQTREINSDEANIVLIRWLHWLKLFFHGLWVVKDNAVECEQAYILYASSTGGLGINRNYINQRFTYAQGKILQSSWAEDELRQAASHFQIISRIIELSTNENKEDEKKKRKMKVGTALHNSSNRLERFFIFCIEARNSNDISVKVALYVTALEALLGTSTSELTYKLSLRVAILLGKNVEEREELYDTIKSAYGMRSVVVHGDSLSKKQSVNLENLLYKLDEIMRRLAKTLIEDKEVAAFFFLPNKDLEQAFNRLVFLGKGRML